MYLCECTALKLRRLSASQICLNVKNSLCLYFCGKIEKVLNVEVVCLRYQFRETFVRLMFTRVTWYFNSAPRVYIACEIELSVRLRIRFEVLQVRYKRKEVDIADLSTVFDTMSTPPISGWSYYPGCGLV